MNIKEFSLQVGVCPHTIRFYEKNGVLSSVQRLANGHRHFTDKDVRWMEFVLRLKHTGMPLDKIRRYAALREQGKDSVRPCLKSTQKTCPKTLNSCVRICKNSTTKLICTRKTLWTEYPTFPPKIPFY